MFKVEQELKQKFKAAIGQKLGFASANKGTIRMAQTAIEIMRVRTINGLDVNGQPFKNFTPNYATHKKRFIYNKIKRRKAKTPTKYKYAAKQMPDHIRLTGELFEDMAYRIDKNSQFEGLKLTNYFTLFIKPRSAPKAHGLINEMKRNFFGIKSAKEKAQLTRAFITASGIKGVGSIR